MRQGMHGTRHTKRFEGRVAEVGPGLHEVTLRCENGAQVQSQLTFIEGQITFSTDHRKDHQ